MTLAGPRIVVDIGNSRIKWGRIDESGRIVRHPTVAVANLDQQFAAELPESSWAISSVNPPVAQRLATLLRQRGVFELQIYDSAATVPVSMSVKTPETAGADRALAVLATLRMLGRDGPGLVISCGTAITVERVASDGTWEGGAIAAGLSMTARSLHQATAQLPWIPTTEEVTPWGDSTAPAIAAGVFWGTVGAVRELISRQGERTWRVWTGGDAERLANVVETLGDGFRIVPDLVLSGLAWAAFGISVAEEVQ